MRSSRVLIIALVLSLGANLALVGFLAGRSFERDGMPSRMDPTLAFFPVLRTLPESRQAELRPLMRAHFRGSKPEIRRLRHAQRSIGKALTAAPFEAQILDLALADFRRALLASQTTNHQALIRLAEAMSPEERALLADAMRRDARHPQSGPRRPRQERPPQP